MGDENDEDWQARRAALDARLREQRARQPENKPALNRTQGMRGAAEGFKIASEFVAGIIVGVAIGYVFDKLAGTGPFGLIAFLFIGFAAGVLNVIRSTAKGARPNGSDPNP